MDGLDGPLVVQGSWLHAAIVAAAEDSLQLVSSC